MPNRVLRHPHIRRRRIWCEFLGADELRAAATRALLLRYGLEVLVALPPGRQSPDLGDAIASLSRAGVPVGAWPLLDDDAGYWPCARNIAQFVHRARDVLGFFADHDVSPSTVVFDLEPPLGVSHRLVHGSALARANTLVRLIGRARSNARSLHEARRDLRALAARLRAAGHEVMAAVVPTIALDDWVGWPLFDHMLETPSTGVGACATSAMVYSSMIEHAIPAGSRPAYEWITRRCTKAIERGTSRPSLSLGVVGAGKFGDEPQLCSPGDLRRDVAVARATGVDDLALFSLRGVLEREPERWLDAFVG